MTARLAKALAIATLVLFLISGVDVATNAAGGGGLLPVSSMVRGMIFGFGAVALTTAAFFVSLNKGSALVSILLIVTGALMAIAGMTSARGLTNCISRSYHLSLSRILDNHIRNSKEHNNNKKKCENNIFQVIKLQLGHQIWKVMRHHLFSEDPELRSWVQIPPGPLLSIW